MKTPILPKENCLELEQAYKRLQETFDDLLLYNEYLYARSDMLERKVDTEHGKRILAIAELNALNKRLKEE